MNAHTSTPFALASAEAAALAAEIKQRWRNGDSPPDVAAALDAHPELVRFKSAVIDLAYEDYCLREELGFPPDPEQFCAGLPAFQSGVQSVVLAHRLLADRPDLLAANADPWPETGDEVEGVQLVAELGRGGFALALPGVREGDLPAVRAQVIRPAGGRSPNSRATEPPEHHPRSLDPAGRGADRDLPAALRGDDPGRRGGRFAASNRRPRPPS